MNDHLQQAWQEVRGAIALPDTVSLEVIWHLVLGGLLAIYLRWLYARCSASASDADSISPSDGGARQEPASARERRIR